LVLQWLVTTHGKDPKLVEFTPRSEVIALLKAAVEAKRGSKGTMPNNLTNTNKLEEKLTSETRAILFIHERLKTTGKLPPKTDIAKALDVNRRTLDNWTAFKVAYKQLKKTRQRSLPKGSKDKDGNMEARRESGKKST
jgi:hypothetical protein